MLLVTGVAKKVCIHNIVLSFFLEILIGFEFLTRVFHAVFILILSFTDAGRRLRTAAINTITRQFTA